MGSGLRIAVPELCHAWISGLEVFHMPVAGNGKK